MDGLIAYVLAKKTLSGGAIAKITPNEEDSSLDFEFQDGNKQSVKVPGGVSIKNITIDGDYHLKCEFTDGQVIDAGELPGGSSSVVTVENFSELSSPGLTNVLYIVSSENGIYYWDGEQYNKLSDETQTWKKF